MTDRELLENAAKAAGLLSCGQETSRFGGFMGLNICQDDNPSGYCWNPLTDDGDEARLEACLQLHVEWHPAAETVTVGTAEIACTEPYGEDRQAARKRAGVRAAAAIGAAK